jgi:hypothetical protein
LNGGREDQSTRRSSLPAAALAGLSQVAAINNSPLAAVLRQPHNSGQAERFAARHGAKVSRSRRSPCLLGGAESTLRGEGMQTHPRVRYSRTIGRNEASLICILGSVRELLRSIDVLIPPAIAIRTRISAPCETEGAIHVNWYNHSHHFGSYSPRRDRWHRRLAVLRDRLLRGRRLGSHNRNSVDLGAHRPNLRFRGVQDCG